MFSSTETSLRLAFICALVTATACGRGSGPGSENTPAASTETEAPAPVPEVRKPPSAEPATVEPKDALKEADADMRNVLTELTALGVKPIATLSIEEARAQKTPGDAVIALLKKEGKSVEPIAMAKITEKKIGASSVRIYTPKTDAKKPLPVIVYFHGGGWAIADLDTYDASARALADGAKAIVVSAEYQHAPEHKFPAAHHDAIAAYEWVTKNARSFGGDPKRIAVAGESAGGNLALNVAIAARDRGLQRPVHQLLVYPVAQTSQETASYKEWANAKPLDKAAMTWFVEKALVPANKTDPRISLIDANLKDLAPTTIVLAEIDPLRSDGELLAQRLEHAGVEVDDKIYEGVTHEFFGMGAYVADAKAATEYASGRLADAFDEAP